MRVTSRSLPLALVLAASALIVSGCSSEAAVPSAPPAAEAEPLFASDEEALEAAEAAYREYLAVSDRIYGDGDDTAMLSEVAVGSVLEEDLARAEQFRSDKVRTSGATELIDLRLQQHLQGDVTSTEVLAYGCVDTASVTIVDSQGTDIGDPEREATATYELRFIPSQDGELLLAESEFWKAGPECAF